MIPYAETPFMQAYVTNMGKSAKYSLVYVPVSFAFDVISLGLSALMFFTFNVLTALFIGVTLIVVGQALKLTVTSAWMPAITADGMSLKQAMRAVKKAEKKHRRKAFALYVVLVYSIVITNVVAALCTFGSALLLTVPTSYLLLICAQYVNYFTVKGKKYFVTFEDIATNDCKGDTEHFFDYIDETGDGEKETTENENDHIKGENGMDYQSNFNSWLKDERLCEEGRAELLSIAADEKEKEYRFAAEPEFGTAVCAY